MKLIRTPDPNRISHIEVDGAEFVVGWQQDISDAANYQFGSFPSSVNAWVDAVRIDGVWFEAVEVFSQQFLDRMNAALSTLEVLE